MQDPNMTERFNAMQRMLLPTAAVSETLRQNACTFWENQERVLSGMEEFAEGWFKRRHAGTEAALKAGQRMCKAETPLDVFREYQDWLVGVYERVTADQLALQQQALSVAALIQPTLPAQVMEAAEDAARRIQTETARPKAA